MRRINIKFHCAQLKQMNESNDVFAYETELLKCFREHEGGKRANGNNKSVFDENSLARSETPIIK